jgi:hypothetical protein
MRKGGRGEGEGNRRR